MQFYQIIFLYFNNFYKVKFLPKATGAGRNTVLNLLGSSIFNTKDLSKDLVAALQTNKNTTKFLEVLFDNLEFSDDQFIDW